MDLTFLTDYLGCLPDLHSDCRGLVLPGSDQPLPVGKAAREVLTLLDNETYACKGFVCRHSVWASVPCGHFTWDLTFRRFEIWGNVINGPDPPLTSRASQWIEQGLCNVVYDYDSDTKTSDAWGVYLGFKDDHKYDPLSHYGNSPLDFWGEYPEERRGRVAEMLEVLRPLVSSYHPENFVGAAYGADVGSQADQQMFVRYADERLIRHLGRNQFSALLSPVDISLNQWLVAGEPKPANYSIGGILLPG